jgi:hypothetical protein
MKIESFLALLKNVKPSGTDKWMACCPAHNDGQRPGDQSLSISVKGEKILLKCFADCATPDIVKTLNLTMSDLFLGEKKTKNTAAAARSRGARREIEKVYQYKNAGNVLVFEVVRYKPKHFSQRRPDGQGGYINNITGCERVIYRLPQVLAAIGRGETIYHCEGEKDVDNLVALGLEATTSPMGAGNWRSEQALYYHGAKQVVIIPDKDATGSVYARDVAADIFPHVGMVKILELSGERVKDTSDWLAAGGSADQLEKLVVATEPWISSPAGIGNIECGEIRETLKNASAGQYTVIDGKFHRTVWVGKGDQAEERHIPLCNFIARVRQDILKDSGTAPERFLKIDGRLNGSVLPSVTIPDNQFDSMNWIRGKWGIKAQIERSIDKVERHINQAIIKSSGKVPEHTLYTHSGWRDVDGQMVYLTNGGATGRPDIEVELPSELSRYCLPLNVEGNPKEAILKSLDLLDIGELKVTLPALIAPYLAVLNVFEETNFTIWYQGDSGSFKSSLCALSLSHFGNFTEKSLPTNWYGTKTELEKLAFHAKDIVFCIDDFAPPTGQAQKKQQNDTAEYILRQYANRQARVRSNPDMTSQRTYIPRGLLLTSGERLPDSGVSRAARMLPVVIGKDDLFRTNEDKRTLRLTRAQENRKFYPVAMVYYIQWIQNNWQAVDDKFHAYFKEYRISNIQDTDIHRRLIDSISMMQSGYHILLDFAVDMKALSQSTADDMLDIGWATLVDLLEYQNKKINIQKPGERFIEIIKNLLAGGKYILRVKNESGWAMTTPAPGETFIGWDDVTEEVIYLNPAESYRAVFTYCSYTGDYFPSSPEDTWHDLFLLKYLKDIGEEKSRTYIKHKRLGGINPRVLWLKRDVIFSNE